MKHELNPALIEKAMESLAKWPYWVEENMQADIRCARPEMVNDEMRMEMWLYDNGAAKRCVGYASFSQTDDELMTFTIKKSRQ